MSTINEKLNAINTFVSYVKACKSDMRLALIEQGQDVQENATLDTFAASIAAIEGGGGNAFLVQYLDWDNTVLKSQQVLPGGDVLPPANPSRESYNFIGWSGPSLNVQSNLTITAQYEFAPNTVVFVDYKGAIISTQNIQTGGDAIPPTVDWGNVILDSWGDYTNIQSSRVVIPSFHTRDNKTYITLVLDETTGLTPTLRCSMTYGDRIDISWGDGSTSQVFYSSHGYHQYSSYGPYTIEISSKDGTGKAGINEMPEYNFRPAFDTDYLPAVRKVLIGSTMLEGEQAFKGCSNLIDLCFSNVANVLSYEEYKNCTQLNSILIKSTVSSLTGNAFNGCSNLKTVIMQSASVVPLNSTACFANTHSDLKFYVPENLVNSYKTAQNWSFYSNKIYPLQDLAVYGN